MKRVLPKRRIFHDDELERRIREDGYFTMQVMDDDDLDYLREVFKELDPKVDAQFYSSINSRDRAYRTEVDQRLRERLEKRYTELFVDYIPIAFTFIVKRPGPESNVVIHVDDTHVDQNRFTAVNIWCPIVDTTDENGPLSLLPKSHILPYPPRGACFPFPYYDYIHLFEDKMETVYLKAGEAIFYDDMLIHASKPNMSDHIRPAVITGMLPKEGQPIIYLKYPELPEGKIELFEVDSEFYFYFDMHARPEGVKSLGTMDYHPVDMSDEEFLSYFDWGKEKLKELV